MEKRKLQLRNIKYNILCTCLILETLATTSRILRKDFEKFLLKVLHKILIKAGSSNFMLQSAGISTLKTVAEELRLNGISELIAQNSDFLLFQIEKMLRNVSSNFHHFKKFVNLFLKKYFRPRKMTQRLK
jgi:hypothetical protein